MRSCATEGEPVPSLLALDAEGPVASNKVG